MKKGRFTRCTDGPTASTVKLCTFDPVKELYSLGWINDPANLFPILEQSGDGVQYDCYNRPAYIYVTDRVTVGTGGFNADAKRVYKVLRALAAQHGTKPAAFHDAIEREERLTPDERESLCDLVNQSYDFAREPRFEVSPRNVGSRADGSLCLFDIVFSGQALQDALKRPFKFKNLKE